jgi:4-amino-4-deoxy-L-arabinose transferase-like glycosyltransferase
LPGLVIAVFLALKRNWQQFFQFALHPGVLIAVVLVFGWYGLAITRGGEGFVNRQLLSENLGRFFGGSGHSHPLYYYLGYLFSLAIPWCLFYPFMFWDWAKERGSADGDDLLFLQTWFGVMLIFFSVSSGKRAVYLLPIYPALALLLAVWCRRQTSIGIFRTWFLRMVSPSPSLARWLCCSSLWVIFGPMIHHGFSRRLRGCSNPKIAPTFS